MSSVLNRSHLVSLSLRPGFWCLGVDYNIIQINEAICQVQFSQTILHEPLKCCRSITEAKWHSVTFRMADIHYNLALIKTKVSPSDFIKISMSIPLPLTTVEIVDPAKPSAVDIDSLRICDHMPDPSKLSGHKPTKLLAALVRFQMQNILCKMQGAYPMLKCEEDFGLGRTAFKRII